MATTKTRERFVETTRSSSFLDPRAYPIIDDETDVVRPRRVHESRSRKHSIAKNPSKNQFAVWMGRIVLFMFICGGTHSISWLTASVLTKEANLQATKSYDRARIAAQSVTSLSRSVLAFESSVGLNEWAQTRGFSVGVVNDKFDRSHDTRVALNP